jgi:uncharacterized protein YndB with AHSA1/START domain
MSDDDQEDFIYVIYIATTVEKLWTALTDGRISKEYWGGRAVEGDLKVGAPLRWRKADERHDMVRATVMDADPPWHLAMSWTYETEPGAIKPPATRVAYTIEQAGATDVKLTVAHEQFEPGSHVDEGARQGWPAILSSLKSYLETGRALEVTKRWAHDGS